MKKTVSVSKKYASEIAYPTIIITILSLSTFLLSIAFVINGVLPIWLGTVINTIMAYILFTPMHEAGHLNISGPSKKHRWLDEVVGWASGFSLFAPFYIFKVIHFRHHAHTNNPEKDPDHWLASKNLISLLMHATTIFPVYFYNGFKILFSEKKCPQKVKKELITGYLVALFYFGLVAVWSYLQGWVYPLMLWFVPAMIAQVFLAFAFDWLPHHPHKEQKSYLNTRVIDIPALTYVLLSQNYHLVHHLHPRIPFYNYKNAYDEISPKIEEKGVEIIRWKFN